MNRLHHLRETLPINLAQSRGYENCEFLILDYNSTDGLEAWIQENFVSFDGRVKSFITTKPNSYKRSHSRNMVMRLAEGQIIVNLDADNYLGEGFVNFILETFSIEENSFIAPINTTTSDVFGKMCFRKLDFEKIGGYDEQMEVYGFEDTDLRNRLELSGLIKKEYDQKEFCRAIEHTEKERIENESIYKNLKGLYIRKISPWETQFCFLFKNDTFEMASVIDSLFEDKDETLTLLESKKRYRMAEKSLQTGVVNEKTLINFKLLSNEEQQISAIHFYSQIKNKSQMEEKLAKGKLVANENIGYGCGEVFINFDLQNPITLV